MRAIAWETAFKIALRNCSKETGASGQYTNDFGERGMHAIKYTFFQKVSASLVKLSGSHKE